MVKKDMLEITCKMKDPLNEKEERDVYVAYYIDDLLREDSSIQFRRTWLKACLIKIFMVLSREIKKHVNEGYVISSINFEIKNNV